MSPRKSYQDSHYYWLEQNLEQFLKDMGVVGVDDHNTRGLITAHGDKCYSMQWKWRNHGIHFFHGAAIYLLSYCPPFSQSVRMVGEDWVAPDDWVIEMYHRWCRVHLPAIPN